MQQYECDNNGSTAFRGRTIRYSKGVDTYPNGSLDHVGSCRMVEGSRQAMVGSARTRRAEETVVPDTKTSTDYTVREVREMVKDMNQKQVEAFTEGDDRKTVQKLC